MAGQPLDLLPLWAVYPITVIVLLAFLFGGYWYVASGKRKKPVKSDAGVGAISGATLALLAFLLAFVVGFGVSVFQERRTMLVKEANAIGTTYLRAGYLEEPYRTKSRDLLREYTDWRIAAFDKDKLDQARTRSEEIHNELWQMVNEIVRGGSETATTGLYVSTLNDVIDVHTERVVIGLQIRVPPMIVLTMYLIAMVAMFLTGMGVAYAENRNLVALVLLVLVLAAVLYLILDLDRSGEGLLKVPRAALLDLQSSLSTYP